MGRFIKHTSCGKCGSSDANAVYEDSSTYCFSCKHSTQGEGSVLSDSNRELIGRVRLDDITKLPVAELKKRGIGIDTATKFGIRVEYNQNDGSEFKYYAPLYNNEGLVGYQVRELPKKISRTPDTGGCLPFGSHVAGRNGKFLIVTEGVEDCLAVDQMLTSLGKQYRVVATLGTDGWRKNLDYFKSFDKVVICYDRDTAGQQAMKEFGLALGSGKAFTMNWQGEAKDPNELLLEKDGATKFLNALFKAEAYRPDGIITGEEVWERIQHYTKPRTIPYPPEWVLMNEKMEGMREGEISLWCAGTSVGKCLAPDTPVLMANGSVRMILDVHIGDKLMGVDGKARTVTNRHTGQSKLYRVKQLRGMDYVVNENHTMSLIAKNGTRRYKEGQVVNIDVPEYLDLPAREKRALRGWVPSAIDSFENTPEVGHTDPYLLGLWLAEGTENACGFVMTVNKEDYEQIKVALPAHTTKEEQGCYSVRLSVGKGIRCSLVLDGVHGNKHVPDWIKHGTRETRERFLAGYLDGDGSKCNGGIEAMTKSRAIGEGVMYVARSLGFRVKGSMKFSKCQNFDGRDYYRMVIQGNTDTLPMLVTRKQLGGRATDQQCTGIEVIPEGFGDYVGIEVDKDSLFLLSDFTVVHNTSYIRRLKQHVLTNTDSIIGEVELEESPEKTWRGLMQFHGKMPLSAMSQEYKRKVYEETYGTKRIFTVDHRNQFTRGQSLIDKFEYLHYSMGATVIFLDHITLAVSEFGDSGGLADQDRMMNEFLEFVEKTKTHLCIISHLRKSPSGSKSFEQGAVPSEDDLKGSGSLKQISFDIIGVSRNKMHQDEYMRNVSNLHVLKCRETGDTGNADSLYWDKTSMSLVPAEVPEEESEDDL